MDRRLARARRRSCQRASRSRAGVRTRQAHLVRRAQRTGVRTACSINLEEHGPTFQVIRSEPDPGGALITQPTLKQRDAPPRVVWALEQAGVHPLLARLLAARGVLGIDELDDGLARLLSPASLHGAADAARVLADIIVSGK